MLKNKTLDRICCLAAAVMILASVLLWGMVEPVQGDGSHTIGYEDLLFDSGTVHTIDITIDDWDSFIASAAAEEYADCSIVIDGEAYSHAGIRAKGNTSLSSVATLGSTRYSFKVEFNHYTKGMTYHGLDKLSLNNLIQDATMMKDYLAYTLMGRAGVPSSLCSYVQINVNGEPWGLYLAVEGVEDAFLERNGMTSGELYKPDSMSFGGGRGNGGGFDIEQFRVTEDTEETDDGTGTTGSTETGETAAETAETPSGNSSPFGGDFGTPPDISSGMPSGMPSGTPPEMPSGFSPGSKPGEGGGGGGFGGFNFGMGSDDVKLIYTDDDPDSYSNIFDNAKTSIRKKDKERLIESLRKLNAKDDIESVVDTDEVIRYLAVHSFLCNDDSYTGMMVHNYYLYEEDGKLSILPWDYNLAFGGFSASTDATSTVNSPIDSPVTGGMTDSRPLIAWIFSDEEALAKYHEVYDRFIAENIESGWLAEEISRVQEMITPYLEKDESAFYTMDEFSKAVETLQAFCAKRGESIRGQLEGTIPSTSDGQRQADTLVDASEISTADMGSMNAVGGGGQPGGDGGFSMPDMGSFGGGSMPEGMSPPEGFSMPEGFTMPEGTSMPEGMSFPGGGNPFGFGGGTADSGETQAAETGETAADETAKTQPQAPERPADMPEGMGFPGGQQADRSGQWIWTAVCGAVLLAALLVIRRTGAHNQ